MNPPCKHLDALQKAENASCLQSQGDQPGVVKVEIRAHLIA